MPIYFSPSQDGFYNTEQVEYPNLPSDVIEISADHQKQLMAPGTTIQMLNGTPTAVLTMSTLQSAMIVASQDIDSTKVAIIAKGCSYAGKYVAADDTSRTNLGGMATTAALCATNSSLPWPTGLQNWIATDNSLISLPTPQAGVSLAYTVMGWYSQVVHDALSYKSQIATSTNPVTLVAAFQNAYGVTISGTTSTAS